MPKKYGIDVSYAQGDIDFDEIDGSEVGFVIVRSSYGWQPGQKDSKFDRNIKGFQSKNIPCGAYHYSYAQNTDEAIKEAKYCISCIKGNNLQLPVFYDLEDSSIARTGRRVCTDIAKTFCEYMEKSGYKAGLYLNPNWLENYLYKEELLGKYDLWLAQWGVSDPSYSCYLWQYNIGGRGSIKGIGGEVDLDCMYSDTDIENTDSGFKSEFKTGDWVDVINPVDYDSGKELFIDNKEKYTVIEADGNRVVIGINGSVTAAVDAKNLRKAVRKAKTYTYIVRPGDTLSSIAQKYDTTYQKIADENNIKNPNLIYGGQVLYITV